MNSELFAELLFITLTFLKLVFISLACAFMANVLTLQSGPMMVFSTFRLVVGSWAAANSQKLTESFGRSQAEWRKKVLLRKIKFYKSAAQIISCPLCLGPWLVLVGVVIFANEQILQNWLVACGLLYVWLGGTQE